MIAIRRALYVCAVVACVASVVRAETPEVGFANANSEYEAGDYDAAIAGYQELIDGGAADRDLFYNMGNAFFKAGRLGYAVLYYERARQLAPRDGDILSNLALTRSFLADRQFVLSPGLVRRIVLWPHNSLSTRESFMFASAVYVLLSIVVIGFILRATGPVYRLYRRLSVLSPGRLIGLEMTQDIILGICVFSFVFLLAGGSALSKYSQEQKRAVGVVVADEIAVYSGPSSDATLQYRIHEGTMVTVDGDRAGWLEIELPGDLSGWVPADALERI